MGKNDNYNILIQEICILIWNNIITLLHNNLRSHIYNTLKIMYNILKNMNSPLLKLRYEISIELSKSEDSNNAIPVAKELLKYNIDNIDYGSLDFEIEYGNSSSGGSSNITSTTTAATSTTTTSTSTTVFEGPTPSAQKGLSTLTTSLLPFDRNRQFDTFTLPYYNILHIKSLVYSTPIDIEGQVLLWLKQAENSKNKGFIEENTKKSLFLMFDIINYYYPNIYTTSSSNNNQNAVSEESKLDTTNTTNTTTAMLTNPNTLVTRNSTGNKDYNLYLSNKGQVAIPSVEFTHILTLLQNRINITSTTNTSSSSDIVLKYTVFTPTIQLHYTIMYNILKFGHLLNNINIVQNVALFLLQAQWDPSDKFVVELINIQVRNNSFFSFYYFYC